MNVDLRCSPTETVVVLVLAMTVVACGQTRHPSAALSVDAAQRPHVPVTAPDTVPAWVHAPRNLASDTGASYQYYADIILVCFTPDATQTERQAAIDAVGGEVVGGQPMPAGEGFYYVRLNARRRLEPLANAVTKLWSVPQVTAASLVTPLEEQSRRPGGEGGPAGPPQYLAQNHGSLAVVPAPHDTARPPVPTMPNLPADTMLTVELPGVPRSEELFYRNIIGIIFDDTTNGSTVRRLFARYGGTIIGGVPGDKEYFVEIPDPGSTFAALDSLVTRLNAEGGVKLARHVYRRWRPIIDGRHPSPVVVGTVLDSAGTHPVHPSRVQFVSGSAFVLGDSLGRFTLPVARRGKQTIIVRGIGFLEQRIGIVVDRDTVRLPDIRLRPNHTLDSVRVIAP